MFKYKREAIFEYKNVELLDQIDESDYIDFYIVEQEITNLRTDIDTEIKNNAEYFFRHGFFTKAKQLSTIRRRLKNKKSIDFEKNELDQKLKEKIELLVEKENLYLELEKKLKLSLINGDYSFLLNNALFKKYLKEVQPINYKYILDEDKYHKAKDRKTRYSYIQRNIMKSNTISYSGITSFRYDMDLGKIRENRVVNPYYITSFIILMSKLNDVKKMLKYRIPIEINLSGEEALFNAKLYLMSIVKGFYVRDNLLFRKDIIEFINRIRYKKEVTYIELDSFSKGADILIQNDVVSPNFLYYFKNLDKFEEIVVSNKDLDSLYKNPESFDDYQKDELVRQSNCDKKMIERLISAIKNTTKFINYPSQSMNEQKYNEIQLKLSLEQKEFIKRIITRDENYNNILNTIIKLDFQNKDLLNLLFEIESKIIYKSGYWDDTNIKKNSETEFDLYEKRSFQIFFNQLSDGKVIINNIFPGNGFLLGREFPKLDRVLENELISQIHSNYSNDFQFYELVINKHTSIINNTGNSGLPKLNWPEDLCKVKIEFWDNKLTFLFDGEPINILYLGSIPPQQFSGVERILLQLISPWKMKMNDGLINNIINKRKIFQVNSVDLLRTVDRKNIEVSTINLLRYFQKNNLPKRFFLYTKSNSVFNEKPQYITLFNRDAVNIFINEIIKGKHLLVMECKPYKEDYCEIKLEESICVFNEEELF